MRIQLCVSGAAPRWMFVSRLRSCTVMGPGSPLPIRTSPPACFTPPMGVMTAAVPQPKTSVTVPSAAPSSHSCPETRRSVT